jgi:hypothetical protein
LSGFRQNSHALGYHLVEEQFMRAYVMTTGVVFGLLTLAHVWRVIEEGSHLATEPWYVLITVCAAALGLWAWRLLQRYPRA